MVLCLVTVLSMAWVQAEGTTVHQNHCICGKTTCTESGHKKPTWAAWDGTNDITYDANGVAYVYLTQDVTRSDYLFVPTGKTLYLCLNGHSIIKSDGSYTIYIGDGGTLTLCDCEPNGKKGCITHVLKDDGTRSGDRGVSVNGSFTMYGGEIANNNGGVTVGFKSAFSSKITIGSFTMYGGTIRDNELTTTAGNEGGGGVRVNKDSSFAMYGGTICDNKIDARSYGGGGVYVMSGSFIMENGTITGNESTQGGGGVEIRGGTIAVTNSTIRQNKCGDMGGGILIVTTAGTISNSTVSGNMAGERGGGLLLMSNNSFGLTNSTITGNTASIDGGGLVIQDATVTISGNLKINGNTKGGTIDSSGKLTGGDVNNVLLWNRRDHLHIGGKLTGGAGSIGVTTTYAPSNNSYEVIAEVEKQYIDLIALNVFTYENDDTPISTYTDTEGDVVFLRVCKHSFNNKWITGNGQHWHTCKNCDSTSEKVNHTFDKKKVSTNTYFASAATCTEGPKYYYSCECGEKGTETFTSGNALGHNYSVSRNNGKAATCTTDGKASDMQCSRCPSVETGATINALGHSYGTPSYSWDGGKCTALRTCSRDDSHIETETVTAVVKVTQEKTCELDELSTYTASFENAAFEKQTKEDVVTASKLGHDFSVQQKDNTQHWKKCSRCDATTEKSNHGWDAGTVTTEPTCTKAGVKLFTCTCGATKTESVDALQHSYGTPTYSWDGDKCTARRTCSRDGSHVETEIVTAAVTVTQEKTCELNELSTYMATFENAAFKKQVKENVVTASKLGHDFSVQQKDNTQHWKKCSRCDATTEKSNHVWDAGNVTTEPTCTKAGVKTFTCAVCKATKTESVDALQHDYGTPSYSWKGNECTARRTCSRDGSHVETEIVTAVVTVTQNRTCILPELSQYTATFTNSAFAVQTNVNVETNSALGHNWAAASCLSPKTCTRCQVTDGQPLGHDYTVSPGTSIAATCTADGKESDMKCSRCDDVKTGATIKAKGHTSGAAVKENEVPASCLKGGSYDEVTYCTTCQTELSREQKATAAKGHDIVHHEPKTPTCTEFGWNAYDTCSRCDYTTYQELTMLGHNYSEEWSKDESGHWHECSRCAGRTDESGHTPGPEATDTTAQTCTKCGYVIEAARGHELEHHAAKAPTCTEFGWDAYDTCKRCDYTTYVKREATGHTEEPIPAVPATCTENGKTEGKRCSVCNAVLEAPQTVDALGHDPIHHEAQAATCTSIGWNAYDTCKRCSYTTYQEQPVLGHDTVHHEAKEATCLSIGWKAYDTCTRCDYTTYQEQSALGHDWTDATCTTPRTCARCAVTEGTALGHDWGNWIVTTPATELAEGVETRTCRHDASHTQTRVIPKLPARTYDITGEVRTSADDPFEGVTVTLMLGNRQLAFTVTGSDGRYGFNNIAPGDYNLVAAKDGVTMTVKVTVRNRNVTVETITMPVGKTNSIVEVKSDDPQEAVEAVVGNLEKLFTDPDAGEVYTDADKEIVKKGGSVDIKLTLTKTDEEQTSDKISESLADGDSLGLRLELEVSKIVKPSDGEAGKTTEISDTGMLLETLVHLPEALQGKGGYTVYRLHDGAVETLTTTPNEKGEYIEISADKTSITIHARLYSEYVIAYQEAPVQPDQPQPDPTQPERPGGGHTNRRFPAGGTANTANGTDSATGTDKTVKSSDTGDMGVALYAVTALLSISGMAWAGRKRGR